MVSRVRVRRILPAVWGRNFHACDKLWILFGKMPQALCLHRFGNRGCAGVCFAIRSSHAHYHHAARSLNRGHRAWAERLCRHTICRPTGGKAALAAATASGTFQGGFSGHSTRQRMRSVKRDWRNAGRRGLSHAYCGRTARLTSTPRRLSGDGLDSWGWASEWCRFRFRSDSYRPKRQRDRCHDQLSAWVIEILRPPYDRCLKGIQPPTTD